MSNSSIFEDFYQVHNVTFDISKLRADLEKVLKKSKYQTLGITNFHAIPMNKIPGDDNSTSGHNVRGVYWTKPDETGKEVMRDKPIDESKYTELISEFKNTYFEEVYKVLKSKFLSKGPMIKSFERKISEIVKSNYCLSANSGTSALHLACLALQLKKNDIVWTVPNTYAASANCALHCGATIDFVDIDEKTYNISIE